MFDTSTDCQRRTPLALCPVLPGQKVYGKQHPRTRIGYRVDELVELNARLAQSDLRIESVCCRIDGDGQPIESVDTYQALPSLSHIGRVDWLLSLPHLNDEAHALLACRALFATAALPDGYLFVDPPQDLDRTMDACHGLLIRAAIHVQPFTLCARSTRCCTLTEAAATRRLKGHTKCTHRSAASNYYLLTSNRRFVAKRCGFTIWLTAR